MVIVILFLIKRIQTVDMSENGLLSLPPPYAWKSRGVREIKMTGNRVSKLDFSDCGRFWPRLESLYLGQNKLKEVRLMYSCIGTLGDSDNIHGQYNHVHVKKHPHLCLYS